MLNSKMEQAFKGPDKTYRSIWGVSDETGIPEGEVAAVLNDNKDRFTPARHKLGGQMVYRMAIADVSTPKAG